MTGLPGAPEAPQPGVLEVDGGVFVAVVDGLGHGAEAEACTQQVIACLQQDGPFALREVVRQCHEVARGSRGAVIGIAEVDPGKSEIRFVGVGNVSAVVATPAAAGQLTLHRFVSSNGIVGYNLPRNIIASTLPYRPGDMIVMWSDGIEEHFDVGGVPRLMQTSVDVLVAELLSKYALTTDDATLVIGR